MLGIAYPRAPRDVLVEEGTTGAHHLLDQSGRTTLYIERADDYNHAWWLVRLSYLYHVNVLKNTPAGAAEYTGIDVDSELDSLDPTAAVRPAFEQNRSVKAGTSPGWPRCS